MTTSEERADVPVRAAMPPVVYVPTTAESDPRERQVVMHTIEDGRTALYTYSAPDRLDSFYRPGNPWVLLDVAALQAVHDRAPYDVLFVDVDPALEDDDASVGDGSGALRGTS